MNNMAIEVSGLSKCYLIYDAPHDRLKQFLLPRLGRIVGKQTRQYYREFWALKDISFNVRKGEAVGIIGRNGSGKSTLLQLICGTLTPTAGTVETRGKIAALLELGSGFNPEFTGRENVYMNGAVLGLSQEELEARFDEIAAFADIGEFIEQPVKTYSSGMVVRLAFAVSVCVEPEILVVDEALSVGDALFHFKCMDRIKALTEKGTTLLFVSHDIGLVKAFCNRAIYLHGGQQKMQGAPDEVAHEYFLDIRNDQRMASSGQSVFRKKTSTGHGMAFGTGDGWIDKIGFLPDFLPRSSYRVGDVAELEIQVVYGAAVVSPSLSVVLMDRRMVDISGQYFLLPRHMLETGMTKYRARIAIPVNLASGLYHLMVRLEDRQSSTTFVPVDKQAGAVSFEVVGHESPFLGMVDIGMTKVDGTVMQE